MASFSALEVKCYWLMDSLKQAGFEQTLDIAELMSGAWNEKIRAYLLKSLGETDVAVLEPKYGWKFQWSKESVEEWIDDLITLSEYIQYPKEMHKPGLEKLAADLTQFRQTVSQLDKRLDGYPQLKSDFTQALDQIAQLDSATLEKHLSQLKDQKTEQLSQLRQRLEQAQREERELEIKLAKTKADLERRELQLKTLEQTRPLYMDEYEQVERRAHAMFEEVIESRRILDQMQETLAKKSDFVRPVQVQQVQKHIIHVSPISTHQADTPDLYDF